ncbi:hypothetical protein D3C76_852960 [compost metagenome]
MSALKKETKMALPRRPKEVVRARPAMGSHKEQVENAFALAFERYEKAFEDLAKV